MLHLCGISLNGLECKASATPPPGLKAA
jgi:hypothetical protein